MHSSTAHSNDFHRGGGSLPDHQSECIACGALTTLPPTTTNATMHSLHGELAAPHRQQGRRRMKPVHPQLYEAVWLCAGQGH